MLSIDERAVELWLHLYLKTKNLRKVHLLKDFIALCVNGGSISETAFLFEFLKRKEIEFLYEIIRKRIMERDKYSYKWEDSANLYSLKRSMVRQDYSLELQFSQFEHFYGYEIEMLTPFDSQYSFNLLELHFPPAILFAAGETNEFFKTGVFTAGVVGSRNPTSYGLEITKEIAALLSEEGVPVVSGLAKGIDITAQRTALKNSNFTCAVLGSGLLSIYPKEHQIYISDILKRGVIVSEYLPNTPPMPHNFPERNRIIAALSHIVIVVEAKERSGVFSTVENAVFLGKDIWAVPGSVRSELSKGPNKLIAEGAFPLVDFSEFKVYISQLKNQ